MVFNDVEIGLMSIISTAVDIKENDLITSQ